MNDQTIILTMFDVVVAGNQICQMLLPAVPAVYANM